MSVIFGKTLYPIPEKMPSKRFARFRGYHTYIKFSDYQAAISLTRPELSRRNPPPVCRWQNHSSLKKKRRLKIKPSSAFHSGKYDENVNISGTSHPADIKQFLHEVPLYHFFLPIIRERRTIPRVRFFCI